MSIVTTQQLARYFEQYRTTEVTFNRQVAAATGLMPRNVYMKLQDRQLSCAVLSSSMAGARVIAGVSAPIAEALKQVNNRMSLRWCFKLPDKVEPITFFVPCHATAFVHYAAQDPDVQMVTLEYTQRPPDDLILILGTLLEANANAQRRKDERIPVTPESMKKMGLESREATLVVDRVAYRCVLRDLSFSGASLLLAGAAADFAGRRVILKISRGEPGSDILLAAAVRRSEEVGGHKEIISLGIECEGTAPMTYKLLISSYLSAVRKAGPEGAEPPHG